MAINLTSREKLRFATWLNEVADADLALAETWRSNNLPEGVIAVRMQQVRASKIVAERLLLLRREEEERLARRKPRGPRKAAANGSGEETHGTADWLYAFRTRGDDDDVADVNPAGGSAGVVDIDDL